MSYKNNKMKHKVKVIMLPTKDKSCITFDGTKVTLHSHEVWNRKMETPSMQHLYVTVSQDVEKIKEGDCWYYDSTNKTVNFLKKGHGWGKEIDMSQYSKIIATTNPKLLVVIAKPISDKDPGRIGSLPQVQQSFIKQFIVNPDETFVVEYNITNRCCGRCDGVVDLCWCDQECDKHNTTDCSKCFPSKGDILTLKLNQDNTVNITSVKGKMYSELELKRALCEYSNDSAAKVFKWVKKNL
jgi:hypothetical protein